MQKAIETVSCGLTLRGMLHMPDGITGNVPAVIMFHGFTGNKMEPHFIFVKLSRRLEKVGIASVRFDFGNSGESDGDFINMTLSGEIDDAHNILDFTKSMPGIDTDRIGVVGLSMGGAVASALAGKRKDEIKALCLWAPAGNIGELIMKNDIGEHIEHVRRVGYADRGGYLVGMDFVDDVLSLDIYGTSKEYDKKVLILHGDMDTVVPLSTSHRYLEIYGDRAELKVIEGADHTFNSKAWEEEVLDRTVNFFVNEL